MLRVALTGGIACGKSVVSSLLLEKGCVVQSADEAAHAVMAPGRPAWTKIVARFGRGILKPDRTIDRNRLGRIVFSDPEARRFLNALIHPLVMAGKRRLMARLEREGRTRIFVSEAALTIEAGYARFFDKVVVVHCQERIQLRRLMARDGIDRAAALRKIGAQMSLAEKLGHADYAVDTSGSLRSTIEQTERLYAALLLDAELKSAAAKKWRTRSRRKARPGALGKQAAKR